MAMPNCSRDPSLGARTILAALNAADLPALERALDCSLGALPPFPDLPAGQVERLELLWAVASELRRALHRVQRGLSRHLEGAETMLALLRHLARTPPISVASKAV